MREAANEGYHYYRMPRNEKHFLQPGESQDTFQG